MLLTSVTHALYMNTFLFNYIVMSFHLLVSRLTVGVMYMARLLLLQRNIRDVTIGTIRNDLC